MANIKWAPLTLALVMGLAVPAQAGWKLIEHNKQVNVGKGALAVTPGESWNRSPLRPIKKGEVWTIDGQNLNELYLVSGLAPSETLFRDIDKKNRPLPALNAKMLLTDIPDFYESSSRIVLQTSLFETETAKPITFAGRPGIEFTFHYGVKDSPIIRKGIAAATLVNGQLYLISFVAPSIYYFDRDRPKAEAIFASAKI